MKLLRIKKPNNKGNCVERFSRRHDCLVKGYALVAMLFLRGVTIWADPIGTAAELMKQNGTATRIPGTTHPTVSSNNISTGSIVTIPPPITIRMTSHRYPTPLPHVFHLARPALLQSLSELLNYWECMEVLVIIDSQAGISSDSVKHYLEASGLRTQVLQLDNHEHDIDYLTLMIETHRYVALLCGPRNTASVLRHSAATPLSFAVQRTWLLIGRRHPLQLPTTAAMRPCAEAPRCQLIALVYHTDEKSPPFSECVIIHDVFLPSSFPSLQSQEFAKWRLSTGLRYLSLREANLSGAMLRRRIIRTTSVQLTPYMFANSEQTEMTGGYIIELLDALKTYLNVEFTLKQPLDTAFGMSMNGTFTGMVGTVQTGEADMSQGLLAMTEARARVVRYTTTVCFAYLTMAIPRPDARVPPTIFILPFSRAVWLALLVTAIAVLFALVASLQMTRREQGQRLGDRLTYWLLAGEFVEQALTEVRGASSRAVMLSLLATVIVSFAYYCTALTSFLTYRDERLPFNTLLEMSRDRDHKVLLVKYSKYHEQFKNAPAGDPYQAVWSKIVRESGGERDMIRTFDEGHNKLLTGKYVMIADGPSVHYFDRDACRLAFPEQKFNTEWMYLMVRKDFPYHRIISNVLTRFLENGVMSRLKKLHLKPGRDQCRPERASQSLGFSQLVPLFVFVALGAQLALLALLGELGYARKRCGRTVDP